MKRIVLPLLWAFLTHVSLSAQVTEICNDGIDNDNDGYIDCYDQSCYGDSVCGLLFNGYPGSGCAVSPPISTFSISVKWVSSGNIMDARQTPVVGDIDNDGIPEVLGKDDAGAGGIFSFDGQTGVQELSIPTPQFDIFSGALAIADVDRDSTAEIFAVSINGAPAPNNRRLLRYEHDGTLTWTSSIPIGYNVNSDRWTPEIADFNGDGIPEIYMGNQIYNSLTGALIGQGGATNSLGVHPSDANEPFSVAADMLPDAFCANCTGLELVCGNQVYSVDIAGGTVAVEVAAPAGYRDGYTSIADMDLDGDLDAVICSRSPSNRGEVYIWDGQTSVAMGRFQLDLVTAAGAFNTSVGGHPNIGDFDGDGLPEIGTAGRNIYLVMDFDTTTNTLTELWSRVTFDGSQRTGSTLFDFNGDGINEVVYRDEDTLFVYAGPNGNTVFRFPCISGTRTEYPLVVDIDADSLAEIVCTCGGANGNFTVFEGDSTSWLPSRPVWNQHCYSIVNINDDLTVPPVQQPPQLPVGNPQEYSLNGFLRQLPVVNGFEQSPVLIADDSIPAMTTPTNIVQTGCGTPAAITTLNYEVCNHGADTIPVNSRISLYNGNPYLIGSTFIGFDTLLIPLPPGQCAPLSVNIPHQGGPFTLFVQANDTSNIALPLSGLPATHIECDLNNNLQSVLVPSCPLPVEWLSLKASYRDQGVSIEWETQYEINNDFFQVERSQDGIVWASVLNRVPSKYTGGSAVYSQFDPLRDLSSLPTSLWYRIRQTDLNGDQSISQQTQVILDIDKYASALQYWPDPFGEQLQIALPGMAISSVDLYDLRAKRVLSSPVNSETFTLSTTAISPGVYFLKVHTPVGSMVKKVVKTR